MSFYFDEENVNAYIEMAKGYDGKELIDILSKYVPDHASVLELGMGPGVDLELLLKRFKATGSDNSQVFLDRFKKLHPNADLLFMDLTKLDASKQFDAIYSNKVLMHLKKEELKVFFSEQAKLLPVGGIAMHALWYGEKVEEMEGLYFQQYTQESLKTLIDDSYEILELTQYSEMEEDDSLYVVLKKV